MRNLDVRFNTPLRPLSRSLSKLLDDDISLAAYYAVSARPDATMPHSTRPCTQPLPHLPTDRNVVDEYELVRPALNSDTFDGNWRQQVEDQEDEAHHNKNKDSRQS
jgi:hypothetical protein